ncbi:hypothetical protein FB451DRAFT_1180530 [Mycena latifolia]|nr:hypothetical protein FB451DRAFT_1180530 [Mycena latifolia]
MEETYSGKKLETFAVRIHSAKITIACPEIAVRTTPRAGGVNVRHDGGRIRACPQKGGRNPNLEADSEVTDAERVRLPSTANMDKTENVGLPPGAVDRYARSIGD